MIFASMPSYRGDEREILLLAHSLRRYGGEFANAPILVLEAAQSPLSPAARHALTSLGASILPFNLPEPALTFPYAQKVYAAAEAEAQAGSDVLVWMDADTAILDNPVQFVLPAEVTIGCCPVQLKNISSLASEPPSPYWQAVYAGCDTPTERIFQVTTTVDHLRIHAQFNAGLLVVHPQARLLRAWKQNFEQLYQADTFRPFYAENELYRIFIHQAVLSATLLTHLPFLAFHIFPAAYNCALFLRHRFPFDVGEPVTCRYDEFSYFQTPGWDKDIQPISDKINHLRNQIVQESKR